MVIFHLGIIFFELNKIIFFRDFDISHPGDPQSITSQPSCLLDGCIFFFLKKNYLFFSAFAS